MQCVADGRARIERIGNILLERGIESWRANARQNVGEARDVHLTVHVRSAKRPAPEIHIADDVAREEQPPIVLGDLGVHAGGGKEARAGPVVASGAEEACKEYVGPSSTRRDRS